MEKKVAKIKCSIFIIIIIVSILIIGGIIAVIVCETNEKNNTEIVSQDEGNKENSITIRYAYAYNVATAELLNEINKDEKYIDILEIKLKDENLRKINSLLEKQSYKKVNGIGLEVLDVYEVNINDEIELSICPGEDYAYYTNGKKSFLIEISEELVNEIDRIVQEEAKKNIKEFSSKKITIISADNEQISITDEEDIKQLKEKSTCKKVNADEKTFENEKKSYTVDFNNGTKIYLYFASSLGKIIEENGKEYYVAFTEDYEDIVETMFENYISGRNDSIRAEEIIVKYLGKDYRIKDEENVEYIINKLKVCKYDSYRWLDDFTEEDYGEEDIVITIGNNKVIIPGNKSIGNRYYIDEKGKTYMIWGLNDLEKYFKELVDYED